MRQICQQSAQHIYRCCCDPLQQPRRGGGLVYAPEGKTNDKDKFHPEHSTTTRAKRLMNCFLHILKDSSRPQWISFHWRPETQEDRSLQTFKWNEIKLIWRSWLEQSRNSFKARFDVLPELRADVKKCISAVKNSSMPYQNSSANNFKVELLSLTMTISNCNKLCNIKFSIKSLHLRERVKSSRLHMTRRNRSSDIEFLHLCRHHQTGQSNDARVLRPLHSAPENKVPKTSTSNNVLNVIYNFPAVNDFPFETSQTTVKTGPRDVSPHATKLQPTCWVALGLRKLAKQMGPLQKWNFN